MTDPVAEFAAVMRRLRAECPWKAEQTHRSLVRYLLEETAEVVDAIDEGERSGDYAHLGEELGDLLLQVVFHAVIAEQRGDFTLDDVARGITDKMIRRNPHVFGPDAGSSAGDLDAAEVDAQWQLIKAQEKPRDRADDGIGPTLSALVYADKVLARLERAGTPAAPDPASSEIGERLLALVDDARRAGVDAEQALRDAVRARL